jgi:surfeit locus 1 family protein
MTDRPEQESGAGFDEAQPRPRSFATLLALAISAVLLFAGFLALGTWQLQRLEWKHALIERVEQRVHAPPVAAPGPERWPDITAATDEYRHVRVTGTFLHEHSAVVQAVTRLGSGYWLLTPLRTHDGNIVLVNRGFVTPEAAARIRKGLLKGTADSLPHQNPAEITGLLRISEPGGGFLRSNDPAADRWFSRDVAAIAASRDLGNVAPYFIDADAATQTTGEQSGGRPFDSPVGGLTVVSFPNNHMVYALTWYALALMVACAAFWFVREERRRPGTRTKSDNQERKHGRQGGN